ncbi:hypothetical protein SUGI_0651510 [Cryptomeria japonica]|nr:hypothetical protein SUGI_0651510 [Cryptomeria japonica]
MGKNLDAFDGNGDGQISVSDLGQALQGLGLSILNCIPNVGRLRRIFYAFDDNGDGHISIAELGQALHRLGLLIPLPENGSDGLNFDAFVGLNRSRKSNTL